jgi:hypothetical protein
MCECMCVCEYMCVVVEGVCVLLSVVWCGWYIHANTHTHRPWSLKSAFTTQQGTWVLGVDHTPPANKRL